MTSTEEIFQKIAEKALGYLESAELFAKTELPLYLQEVIKYNIVVHWCYVIFLIGILFIMTYLFYKWIIEYKHHEDFLSGLVPLTIFYLALSGWLLSLTSDNFKPALKATISPRVYLVDYFRGKE